MALCEPNARMKRTIGLALFLVVIQEPRIGGKYPDSNQSTKTSPLLSRRSKVENGVSTPLLARWKAFILPLVKKNPLFVFPLVKRVGHTESSLIGVPGSKRFSKNNYPESTDQTNVKLPNSNFTGVPLLINSSSVKTAFDSYTTTSPKTIVQKASKKHSQNTTTIANVEVTEKDLNINNETKRFDATSPNKSNTKESLLIQDYKILGGDEDEDSARWALEEINQNFKTKAKNLKTNSEPLVESEEQSGKDWKNRLKSKQSNETSSSKHSKHFDTSNTSVTDIDLEQNACINCQNTSTVHKENQAPNSVNQNKSIVKDTYNASFTPSPNEIVLQAMFPYKNPNKTRLNQTSTPFSEPSIIPETAKQQLPFQNQRNPHKTETLNRTIKTISNATTSVLETKINSEKIVTHRHTFYEKKPSLNDSFPVFSINKTSAEGFKLNSNDRKVTMKSLSSTSSPLWKPFIPTRNSSSQKFDISTNKTLNKAEKSAFDETPQAQPTEAVVHAKTVTAPIRNHSSRPMTHPNELNDLSREITKKPSLNLRASNLSLSNRFEPKPISSQQERPPQQSGDSKSADAVEVIDDYLSNTTRNISQHALLTDETKRPTHSSKDGYTLIRPSLNKLNTTLLTTMKTKKYGSNRLSYTPTNSFSKPGGTLWKASPVHYSASVIKRNTSIPYQPVIDEVLETFGMKKTNQHLNGEKALIKGFPTKSKSWWGDTPSVSFMHLNSALPTSAHSPISNPFSSYSTRYKSPVGINGYRIGRGRRTSDLLDLSSESSGEKEQEGSSSDAKPKSKGTIVIKLMSRYNEEKGNATLKDGALPLKQFSDNLNNTNQKKPYRNQSAEDTKYIPHSTITLKLSRQQKPKDLHKIQQNINEAKKPSDHSATDKGKKLELKVFHISPTPNVEIKNGEDFIKQVSVELGTRLKEENSLEKNEKNISNVMKNSEKIFEPQDTYNGKELILNEHKDTTRKPKQVGMKSNKNNENNLPHSERGKSLRDERKKAQHRNSKTQTIKGIKSLTISLQKGNDSLPIIQQLGEGDLEGQSSTFQVTASTSSDNSFSSLTSVNDSPSLSLTVTTDDSDHGTRINGTSIGNKAISLDPLIKNGEFGDQMEGHDLNWTKTQNQFNKEPNIPKQNYNVLSTTTKNLKGGEQNKNNLVILDEKFSDGFQPNVSFKLPEEQKISVVNEKQKLVIPLALSQEYKQDDSDQTLAGQEYPQNDVTLLNNALPGEKTGNQAPNLVTVGDPTEQRWTQCRASPSTQGGGGLTILNCDNKGPSEKQAMDLGMETKVPATEGFFQGVTEPSGIGYPIPSLAITAQQSNLKGTNIKNRVVSQDLRQKILNDVNSELKAEGNLITKLVAESTQVKPDPRLGYNLGESSFFTDSSNPVSLPPINPSTFWDAGLKARLSFSPATFQAPFVHQFQGPPHHKLGKSRHSLPFSYPSPVTMHRLGRSKHRTMGDGVPNPFLFLNTLRMPLVHHLVRPTFPHVKGGLPLNRQFLHKIGLHKRFQIRTPVDGPPGKRTHILRNRPKPTRGAGNYRFGVGRPNEGEWAYLGRVFCCCPSCT